MSTEATKANLRRLYDDAWNQGRLNVLDEINSPNYHDRSPAPGLPANTEGVKQLITMYRAAFPDTHFTVDDMVAEGDRVVVRWTAQGTHRQELMGIPATNKHVSVTGIDQYRIENGKAVEHWGNWDQLGMLQQLGVVALPGQAAREVNK